MYNTCKDIKINKKRRERKTSQEPSIILSCKDTTNDIIIKTETTYKNVGKIQDVGGRM